ESRGRRPRELNQALHDPIEAQYLFQDQVGELAAGIPALDPSLQDLGGVSNPRERISDLVGDARGERAERSQPVAAPPLLFLRLLLSQILKQRYRPNQGPVAPLEREQPKADRQDIPAAGYNLDFPRLLRLRAGAGRNVALSAGCAKDPRGRLALHL